MRKTTAFLFAFGFETPAQHRNNAAHGWDDADSQAVFIVCGDSDAALEWGREIAEQFVRGLWAAFGETGPSWKDGQFPHWIETSPDHIARAQAVPVPRVRLGEHPRFGSHPHNNRLGLAHTSMHRDNRPLFVGLAAAIVALALVLTGPSGSLWRDALWSLCITSAALSLGWFERRLSSAGRPSRLLRWTAIGLVIVAMAFFAVALRR